MNCRLALSNIALRPTYRTSGVQNTHKESMPPLQIGCARLRRLCSSLFSSHSSNQAQYFPTRCTIRGNPSERPQSTRCTLVLSDLPDRFPSIGFCARDCCQSSPCRVCTVLSFTAVYLCDVLQSHVGGILLISIKCALAVHEASNGPVRPASIAQKAYRTNALFSNGPGSSTLCDP